MLKLISHANVAELRMDRPPANALNPALVAELLDALRRAGADGAQGLILTGRDGMFSAGLDVPELLGLARPAIEAFWSAFFRLTRALAMSPVPVVAALSGHSAAGGAVLALHCDYRIAATGSFKIGFNEVGVGLPVPPTILLALEQLVGPRATRDLVLRGKLVTMDEALELGFVDELVAPDQVLTRSVELLGDLAALPSHAMNETRMNCKRKLLDALRTADDTKLATDYWFSDETRRAMRRLAEKLGAPV